MFLLAQRSAEAGGFGQMVPRYREANDMWKTRAECGAKCSPNLLRRAGAASERILVNGMPFGKHERKPLSFTYSALACFWMGMSGSAFSTVEGNPCYQPAPSVMLAKLPFRHRSMMGCQPNLVGVVPFLPPLLASAQHMRAPVVAETLRNSQAATGSSY